MCSKTRRKNVTRISSISSRLRFFSERNWSRHGAGEFPQGLVEYKLEIGSSGKITFRAGSAVCVNETQQQRIVDIAILNVRKEESICGERNEERTSRTRPVLDPQGQERSDCLCRTRNPSYSAAWACDSQCSTSRRILLNPLCASRNRWRYCPITSGVQGAQSPQSRVRTRWLRLQPATWRRWILDETFLN
jgi:hypothetical protein